MIFRKGFYGKMRSPVLHHLIRLESISNLDHGSTIDFEFELRHAVIIMCHFVGFKNENDNRKQNGEPRTDNPEKPEQGPRRTKRHFQK